MTINLYNCTDDEKTVNKTLSDSPTIISGVSLKDNTSLLKPSFVFSYNANSPKFSPVQGKTPNYLKCSEWGRYYFIRNVVYSQQSVIVECEIDPLTSHATELLEKEMFVARQQNSAYAPNTGRPTPNYLLPDEFLPIQANRNLNVVGDGSVNYNNYETVGKLNDGDFVLLVNGGYSSI